MVIYFCTFFLYPHLIHMSKLLYDPLPQLLQEAPPFNDIYKILQNLFPNYMFYVFQFINIYN